jgi:hypothetical protein
LILGLDISTSITGFCLLTDDGEFICCDYADLRKEKSFYKKVRLVTAKAVWVQTQLGADPHFEQSTPIQVFIEDKLSGFSGGKTMQQTLMKLATFHGAVRFQMAEYIDRQRDPILIHPSTAKATMKRDGLFIPKGANKKKITLDFVRRVVPEFPYVANRNDNPQPYCYDMADAYLIARAGYLKFICDEGEK